jgi:hypothetical protein
MTEAEWLTCSDVQTMLNLRGVPTDDRKLRLFHVACCREALYLASDERLRRGVKLAEQLADDEVFPADIDAAVADIEALIDEANEIRRIALEDYDAEVGSACGCPRCEADAEAQSFDMNPNIDADFGYRRLDASYTAEALLFAGETLRRALVFPPAWHVGTEGRRLLVQMFLKPIDHRLCELVREVFGNPFRHVVLNPHWLAWSDGCVARIAQRLYNERSFSDLPILSDALEDAGCDNTDILTHCRSGGEHVRGCWVVDLLLGKT